MRNETKAFRKSFTRRVYTGELILIFQLIPLPFLLNTFLRPLRMLKIEISNNLSDNFSIFHQFVCIIFNVSHNDYYKNWAHTIAFGIQLRPSLILSE